MYSATPDILKNSDIEYICNLMFESLKIPILFLNKNNEIMYDLSFKHSDNPLYKNKLEPFIEFLDRIDTCNYPLFFTTKYMENYFYIKINKEDSLEGMIILGPSVSSKITDNRIDSLISEFGIPIKQKAALTNYYNHIPIVDYNRLIRISLLVYYTIYHQKLDYTSLIGESIPTNSADIRIKNEIELDIINNRENNFFHHSTYYEQYLNQCIREGDMEKLIAHLNRPIDGEAGVLSTHPLRSHKNLFICSVTMVTRAAIEGGLNPELAFTISDSYIQHVEELKDIKEIINMRFKMCYDFTHRVSILRQHKYSKAVIRCQKYISEHMHEVISLSGLAALTNLNPNYLSELFKKEVGISIMEYIQKERVEAAKNLLTFSEYSLFDICIYLNFNDQSYFTKIFKRYTGYTPKQYRNIYAVK